jgi:hypothetical protein
MTPLGNLWMHVDRVCASMVSTPYWSAGESETGKNRNGFDSGQIARSAPSPFGPTVNCKEGEHPRGT